MGVETGQEDYVEGGRPPPSRIGDGKWRAVWVRQDL